MNNMSEIVDKLKKGAVDRCQEWIIEAREPQRRLQINMRMIWKWCVWQMNGQNLSGPH